MKIIKIALIILVVIAIGIGVSFNQPKGLIQSSDKPQHHDQYYCPMHPQILYDHPGRCPICGMDLVKKEEAPIQHDSDVKGYTSIVVTTSRQQLAGVRTWVIENKDLIKIIRVPGEYEGEIFGQVFEDDLPLIKVGQKAIVEVPAFHQKYEGAVNSIDSMIDEASRSLRVRIWLKQNNQKQFKTNMFVNIELPVSLGESMIIPQDAIQDTGLRKIVFVVKDGDTFEPREIQTGIETDEGVQVISGLKVGERIVISGNFLLDSESRVQATQGEAHE